MKKLVIIFLLAQHIVLVAQPPYRDSIMRIKGTWQKTSDFLTDAAWKMPRDQQPAALKIGVAMHQLVKNAYPDLKGMNARYYTSIHDEPCIPNAPFPYSANAMYFWYFYNSAYRKIEQISETGTIVRLEVNDPSNMLRPYTFNGKSQYIEADGKKHMIRQLWVEAGTWQGYTVYKAPGKEAASDFFRNIVITKEGPPLWLPVSQIQYLQMLRKQEEIELNAVMPGYNKVDSGMRAMITSIQQLKADDATKEKMLARQRELIRQHEEKRDTTIKVRRALWLKRIKYIDDYLAAASKEMLTSQAVLGMHEFNGYGFAKPVDTFSYRLVIINPAYFNYAIPRYQPQFIVVNWSANMNYEPCRYFKNQFEQNFSPAKIKAMLKN